MPSRVASNIPVFQNSMSTYGIELHRYAGWLHAAVWAAEVIPRVGVLDYGVIGLHAYPVGIHYNEHMPSSLSYSSSYSGFEPPPRFLGDSTYQ